MAVKSRRPAISCWSVAVAVGIGMTAWAQQARLSPPQGRTIVADRTIPVPTFAGPPIAEVSPSGLAWQPTGEPQGRLWVSYGRAGGVNLQSFKPLRSGHVSEYSEYQVSEGVEPGPMVYDTERATLWTFDGRIDRPMIPVFIETDPRLKPPGGTLIPGDSLPFEGGGARRPEVRGVALYRFLLPNIQGEILGVCRGGGLCSSVEVYDLRARQLLTRFFPMCEPAGIAVDPDGRRFWLLADNGPGRGMVLIERHVRGLTVSGGHPHPSILDTRRFRVLERSIRGIAIAATGSSVWVLSERVDPSPRVSGAPPAVHEFVVGALGGSPGPGGR